MEAWQVGNMIPQTCGLPLLFLFWSHTHIPFVLSGPGQRRQRQAVASDAPGGLIHGSTDRTDADRRIESRGSSAGFAGRLGCVQHPPEKNCT